MRALLLLPLLALTACQTESADVSADVTVPEGAAVAVETGDASVVVVGDPVTGASALTTTDLVTNAASLDGQTVLVEGTVRESCRQSGCWLTLDAPGDATVRIAVPKDADGDYAFTFPTDDLSGSRVRLAGTFSVTEESVETLRHLAEDGGASPDSLARITAPRRTLALTATGAEITRA